MKLQKTLTLLLLLFSISLFSQRLNLREGRFFNDNIPNRITRITTLTGNDSGGDSRELSSIIKRVSDSGGGTLILAPHGGKNTFFLGNVTMRNNIHLKIDPRVTIVNVTGFVRNGTIFNFGDDFKVTNASLTSTNENSAVKSDAFKVNLRGGNDVRISAVALKNVTNFKISGINVTDSYTRFNNIVLNPPNSNSKTDIATKGIVQNIFSINNHVGYGIAQVQTAKTVLFKNLKGTGGISLRIETGVATVNVDNRLTVDDVVGKRITCRNGDAAVDLSPHRVDQGQVDVTGIVSIGCTYALRISGGFKDRKEGGVDNAGTFSGKSYFRINRVVGGNNAQVKGRDFQFYNCTTQTILRNRNQNPDDESTKGQSLGIIRDTADPVTTCNNCSVKSIRSYKRENPNANLNCNGSTGARVRGCYKPTVILPPSNKITGRFARTGAQRTYTYNGPTSGNFSCNRAKSIETLDIEENVGFFPNPAKNSLNIIGSGTVIIYDLFGKVLLSDSSEKPTIDVSSLSRGVYMISINNSKMEKLVLN